MIEIIKASAGSGKTYTLAVKYIGYLMKAEENFLLHGSGWVKNVHRRTLAITFTNNSTNEMKQRIVQALYKMKNGNLPDYVSKVKVSMGDSVGTQRIQEAAGLLLQDMLEDWQMVRVSTIDSFFNQVVNAFIRELGIDQTPAVDLDTDTIVGQAVDNLLNRLEDSSPEGKALVRFLGSMMNESISDGKKWSIRPALVKIARHTLTDSYRSHIQELSKDGTPLPTPDRANSFKQRLNSRIKELRSEADTLWKEMEERIKPIEGAKINCVRAIEKHNADSNTLLKALEDPSAWFNKKNNASPDDGTWLSDKLRKIFDIVHGEELNTCIAIASNIGYTGVITELDREVEQICRENDTILISSTNHLINEIVNHSTTPFIYEKTGLGTDHYMIDEFQDTSVKQWENFVPLISESNSMGKESLVVGDVKQSIYRWRNGDWRILQNGINEAFPDQCSGHSLNCNFRSRKGIVDFNNSLYSVISERFADLIGHNLPLIYGEVHQDCNKEKEGGGSVRILFTERKKDDFQSFAMRRIIIWLNTLKSQNQMAGSAILVRKNDEAQFVARALAEAGIRFVSTESLLVANDICVRYIIAAMRYVLDDKSPLAAFRLKSLQRCISGSSEIDHELMECLRWLPLDQVTMAIVRRYGMESMDEGAHRSFVFTLADIIRAWTRNNDGNTNRFLEYWNEKGKTACVPLPADSEAVKIMTIHKSKGLQFSNVALLMNSTSWEGGFSSRHDKMVSVETPQDICESDIKRVFVDIYKANVTGSVFEDEQLEEWEECCIDELNTLYVATTRAECNMFIVGNKAKDKELLHGENFCLVNLLEQALTGWGEELIEQIDEEDETTESEVDAATARTHGTSLTEPGPLPGMMNVHLPKSEEQKEGIDKHAWLATVRYEDEVNPADCAYGELWEKVRKHGWFSRDWETVWNEAELAYRGRTLRPDRVMFKGREAVVIDWKFGQKNEIYKNQVKGYCHALKAMGYSVSGWLYYAEYDEPEQVV